MKKRWKRTPMPTKNRPIDTVGDWGDFRLLFLFVFLCSMLCGLHEPYFDHTNGLQNYCIRDRRKATAAKKKSQSVIAVFAVSTPRCWWSLDWTMRFYCCAITKLLYRLMLATQQSEMMTWYGVMHVICANENPRRPAAAAAALMQV